MNRYVIPGLYTRYVKESKTDETLPVLIGAGNISSVFDSFIIYMKKTS